MADDKDKKDNTTSGPSRASGSGSDTVSAAKISAGTSVGSVGQSPTPQSTASDKPFAGASGGSQAGSSHTTGAGSGSSTGSHGMGAGSSSAPQPGSSGMGTGSQASTARSATSGTQTGTGVGASGSSSTAGSMGSTGGTGSRMGTSGSSGTSATGSAMGKSAQSSTLASHTSQPMGGGAGATGAGQPNLGPEHQRHIAQPQAGQGNQQSQHGSSGSQTGMGRQSGGQSTAEQARQAASQAGEAVRETADQVSKFARETYEQASSWASDTMSGRSGRSGRSRYAGSGSRQSLDRVQSYAAQNPVVVGLVGLAAGLLIGSLLPRTRREDEMFGEWADEVRDQGLRYAHEMGQRGREYVEEAFAGEDPRTDKRESESRPGAGTH